MKMKRWLLQLSIIMGCSAFQQDAKQAPDEGDPMEVVEFNVDVLYERRDYFLEEDLMKIELEAAKHAFEKDVLDFVHFIKRRACQVSVLQVLSEAS